MDRTQVYAAAVAGTFLALFLANSPRCLRQIVRSFHAIRLLLTRFSYLRIPAPLNRIGRWHLDTAILLTIFLLANAYLTLFTGIKIVAAKEVRIRAANLALINLVPVMAGPSQSFLASILGISLRSFQKIHRSLAFTSLILLGIHVIAAMIVNRRTFPLNVMRNALALGVSRRPNYVARINANSLLGCCLATRHSYSRTPVVPQTIRGIRPNSPAGSLSLARSDRETPELQCQHLLLYLPRSIPGSSVVTARSFNLSELYLAFEK